jgi:hypothetical protein
VRFELSGMTPVETMQRVDLGQTARLDATLRVAAVTEDVRVTAELPTILSTTQGGTNFRTEETDKLAMPRTIFGLAELAPGLTDNTPQTNQVSIAGGFGYDTQFLVNGVDIADNLFAQPNNLFIEDAIEEVQVLTSGISAEYGRFGGGVVNAITKSGGDTFSGSGRINFYNPVWTAETPFEERSNVTHKKDLQQNYEGTFGGPIVRQRLWFFAAGRHQKASTPAPLVETGIDFSTEDTNKRGEIKLTGSLIDGANHTLQGSYLNNSRTQHQTSNGNGMDLASVVTRQTPNDLWVATYRGVLSNRVLASVQTSRRKFQFLNAGGTETAIERSVFRTRGVAPGVPTTRYFNAPYFDSTDPETRANRQVTGSLNWFLTSGRLGSHDLKTGYENFVSSEEGGNSQSATGYVMRSDYLLAGGRPALDAQGRIIPLFIPGVSRVDQWIATRGAKLDITTNSFYAHDRWTATPRLTIDLGTRAEIVRSKATGDIIGADTQNIVPRLGAAYDVTGDGRWIAQATYAHYSGSYNIAQFVGNSDVANPSQVVYEYSGPAGQGLDFAPGFNLANYSRVLAGNFPTANVFFEDGLHSPITKEFTLGVGTPFGNRGAAKMMYQWRAIGSFIDDFIDDPSAQTTVVRNGVDFGTFTDVTWRNTDVPKREYQAMIVQGNYRVGTRWSVDGHWTLQLRNNGNFEGEAASQPGNPSLIGDYPEIYVFARNEPEGRLNDFQRHKVRLWTTYTLGLGGFGSVDLGALYRYNSPLTYSLFANGVPISAIQASRDPGYVDPPVSQTLYFAERGSERFESAQMVDLALTYSIPVFRDLRPWIKFELYNAFNNQNLVQYNTAITPAPGSPLDADGLPTQFVRGPLFGQSTTNTHFPRSAQNFAGNNLYARTFLMSFGFRF